MSIPKEPRQLMINIMYLVLTALLALNVSAEIFNAFEMVDKGLQSANNSIDSSNDALPQLIKDSAKKKSSLKTYADRVDPARSISSEASDYINSIFTTLVDEAGDRSGTVDDGDYVMVKSKRELRGKKDYAATTRLMVDEGKGEELRAKMLEYRAQFLQLIDEKDRPAYEAKIPIEIDDEAWKNSINKKENWADFTFGHMPLGATQPIFTKFVNDVKSAEGEVLKYLANKVGTTTDVILDKFQVVSAPKKAYVIKGEPYEADIFLSAAAGADVKTGISVKVGGRALPLDKDGNAKFRVTPNTTGRKTYKADITVSNPVTGESKTYTKSFEYEVGERSVSVSATKMNVFYIGVDNPIEVSAAGVNSTDVKVSMSGAGGGTIKPSADGTYMVNVKTPTKKGEFAKINVSATGLTAAKDFRVKRIPDPVPMLGKERGGGMGTGTFKAYPGLRAELQNFDFDARCTIKGYRLVYAPKRKDVEIEVNPGGKYTAASQRLVNKAKPGDKFYFENIRCSCPGDARPRDIGYVNVNIK